MREALLYMLLTLELAWRLEYTQYSWQCIQGQMYTKTDHQQPKVKPKGNHVGTARFKVCHEPEPKTFRLKKWFVICQCLAVLFCNMDSWNTIYTYLTQNFKHPYKPNLFCVKNYNFIRWLRPLPWLPEKAQELEVKKNYSKNYVLFVILTWYEKSVVYFQSSTPLIR